MTLKYAFINKAPFFEIENRFITSLKVCFLYKETFWHSDAWPIYGKDGRKTLCCRWPSWPFRAISSQTQKMKSLHWEDDEPGNKAVSSWNGKIFNIILPNVIMNVSVCQKVRLWLLQLEKRKEKVKESEEDMELDNWTKIMS